MAAAPAVAQPPPPAAAAAIAHALGDDGISPAGQNIPAPPATPADGASVGNAHWARAGLGAVCRALAEALPGEGATSASCDAVAAPAAAVTVTTRGDGDISVLSARGEAGSIAPGRPLGSDGDRSALDPTAVSMGGGTVDGGGGGRVGEGGLADGRYGGGGDGAESVKSVENTRVTTATATAAAASTAMMDLDDLERLLGAEGSSPPCSIVPREGNGVFPSAAVEAVDDVAPGVVGAEWGSGLKQAARTEIVGVNRTTGADEDGGAWELMEVWTPCALGTLPGWSAARLY